ncbi:MAG: hypothetical protein HC831_09315 [Chloroflexia bacterium]|nr:hypothetical protein [Chloroflexia bacterium]
MFIFIYPQTISANDCDTALINIQNKISDAFMNSFMTGNTDAFLTIENELSQSQDPMHAYWLAYTYYYKSFYFIALEDKVNSEKK